MKTLRVKNWIVFCCSLFLSWQLTAQNLPIATFPYQADFGTETAPGNYNSAWKFYAIGTSMNKTVSNSWSFATQPDQTDLAPCFKKESEFIPSAFTPYFSMEKSAAVSYTLTVSYLVPQDGTLNGDNLTVRITAVGNDNEPFFSTAFLQGFQNQEITDNGKTVSVLLRKHIPDELKVGLSTYTYTISSDQIPQNGNYCFSFHVGLAAKSNTKSGTEIYIESLKVEKKEGMDLAAGQIKSPYSAVNAGTLPVTAFVHNINAAPINEFTAAYQIDDRPAVRQNFTDMALKGGEIRAITFSTYPDLGQGDHRVRFWIESDNDPNPLNDTSMVYCVRAGQNAVASIPATFDFYEKSQYGWAAYSDSVYTAPFWTFVKDNDHTYPYTSTEKENRVKNHDYLVSPLLQMGAEKVYRIEFAYKAVLAPNMPMGEKSLSLLLCNGIDRISVTTANKVIWRSERFDDNGERTIVLYYHSPSEQNLALVFLSDGPFSEGGLQIRRLSVKEAETNQVDFFHDFEAATVDQARNNTLGVMDFVDQDGVMGYGKTGNWQIDNNHMGYNNSEYSLRSPGVYNPESKNGKTNDWLILKPFRLNADTDYYLVFQTKMSDQKTGSIEIYVGEDAPRYDLDFEQQTGQKWQVSFKRLNFDTIRRVFSVAKSGLYTVAIRNTTDVKPDAGDFQEGDAEKHFTLYIDNISLTASERHSVQAFSATVPYEASLGQTVSLSMNVRNHAWTTIPKENITFCYQVDNAAVCREKSTTDIAARYTASYMFNTRADFSGNMSQKVKFWVETTGANDPIDTLYILVNKIIPSELPFVENFSEESWEKWQVYPASRSVWRLTHGTATAHSGEWALKCGGGNATVNDYAVTPLLKVEKDKTYRISFFYKRDEASANQKDSVSLYYEYNRYDQTGFRNNLHVFKNMSQNDYTYCEAFVHFPDAGNVFIGLKADLSAQSSALYIDDFAILDSTQTQYTSFSLSGLTVNGVLSECDTMALGYLNFTITAGGYTVEDEIPLFIRYDAAEPQDITLTKAMASGDVWRHQISMPKFSGGEHRVQVWLAFPHEVNRTDDTLTRLFTVAAPAAMPFKAEDVSVVGQARMTACFEVEEAGTYTLFYTGDASQAAGSSLKVNLLRYGANTILSADEIETVALTGNEKRERNLSFTPGVYALGFECTDLPDGGLVRITDIRLEKVSANRTYAEGEISLHPNPATDRIRIRVPDNAEKLMVSDLQGRVLRRLDFRGQGSEVEISLQGLQSGVYLVRIEGKTHYGIVKLIKR